MRDPAPTVLVLGNTRAHGDALVQSLGHHGIEARHAAWTDAWDLEGGAEEPPGTVVVLDQPHSALTGHRWLEDLRERRPHLRVVVVGDALLEDPDVVHHRGTLETLVSELAAGAAAEGGMPAVTRRNHGSVQPRWSVAVQLIDQLTAREREVLRGLIAGAGGPEIAGSLGISPHTVRTHVQNIRTKLAVGTRLEAVVIGLRAGLRAAPRTTLDALEGEE